MGTCPLMRFRLVIFTLFSIGSSLVSADGRECNYIIRPESDGDKNTTYIGMVFSQITPPINESVLISYTWEGIRYVDEHYSAIEENNLVPKTNRSEPILSCFPDLEVWSTEPIISVVSQIDGNNSSSSVPATHTTDITSYRGEYWLETCGRNVKVGPNDEPSGIVAFPSDDKSLPCNISCHWKIQTEPENQVVWINFRHLIDRGTLTITSFDPDPYTCILYGTEQMLQSKLSKAIYSTPVILGSKVDVYFQSDAFVRSTGFIMDYGWTYKTNQNLNESNLCEQFHSEFNDSCKCFSGGYEETARFVPDMSKFMVSDSQFVENSHYQLTNKTVSEGVFTIFACSTDSDRDTETTQLDLSSTTSQRELSSTTTQRELSSATNQRDLSSTTTKPDWTTTTTAREEPDLPSIKKNVTSENVEEKLNNLTIILNDLHELTPQNVTDAVDALAAAANIVGIPSQDGISFDVSADLVLQKGGNSFTPETIEKLLDAVKNFSMNVNLSIGESSEYYNGTLFVNIVNVVDCGSDAFQVGLIDFNHTASGPLLNTMEPIDHWENSVALIFVHPDSVCPIGSIATRMSFQLYRTTNIFVQNSTFTNFTEANFCDTSVAIGNSVISATVVDRIGNVSEPRITIQIGFLTPLSSDLQKLARNFEANCAYWKKGWIVNNTHIKLIRQNAQNYLFEFPHLTDFTILVSNNPQDKIFCEPGLSILGTVGSSCSLIGLMLVVVSLFLIRYWALSPHPLVIVSLFFNGSLAVFFFCFVLFSDQLTLCVSDKVCTAFAATMYYFLLSTMIWTVCRAALVYKRYVVVFDTGERSDTFTFNRMATLISIVVPFFIVLIVSLTDNSFFQRSDFFCWIDPVNSNYAVVIPISLMLASSIAVIILVIRSVFFVGRRETLVFRSTQSRIKTLRRKFWVLFAIQISLGVPWIFLYLTEIPGTSVFHYLFTITNAFQGVWISLLHFYERRKDVYLLIKEVTKKLSNFLGSTRQARSETPTESTSSFVALSGHTSATESEA